MKKNTFGSWFIDLDNILKIFSDPYKQFLHKYNATLI